MDPSKFDDPLNRIEWRDVDELSANGWNPNVVFKKELSLLESSILKQGWIQPVLTSRNGMIIDGFHRWMLSKNSAKLRKRYGGKLPCVVLDLPDKEAMMLTVRINRAKGTHLAFRMSDLVKRLVEQEDCSLEEIAEGIGADMSEVKLLASGGVFKNRDLSNYEYSKAWKPYETTFEDEAGNPVT